MTAQANRTARGRWFLGHVAVYLVVNAGLFIVDWIGGGGWWFFWVLLGWGVVLVVHALVAFGWGITGVSAQPMRR